MRKPAKKLAGFWNLRLLLILFGLRGLLGGIGNAGGVIPELNSSVVEIRKDFGDTFELLEIIWRSLGIFVSHNVLQSGPKVHGFVPNLNFNWDKLVGVHEINFHEDNKMEALVAVAFGALDVVATLNDRHGRLAYDCLFDSVDVISKRRNNADAGDVADILFNTIDGELIAFAFTFFDDRIKRFDSVFDRVKGRAFATHLCFLP